MKNFTLPILAMCISLASYAQTSNTKTSELVPFVEKLDSIQRADGPSHLFYQFNDDGSYIITEYVNRSVYNNKKKVVSYYDTMRKLTKRVTYKHKYYLLPNCYYPAVDPLVTYIPIDDSKLDISYDDSKALSIETSDYTYTSSDKLGQIFTTTVDKDSITTYSKQLFTYTDNGLLSTDSLLTKKTEEWIVQECKCYEYDEANRTTVFTHSKRSKTGEIVSNQTRNVYDEDGRTTKRQTLNKIDDQEWNTESTQEWTYNNTSSNSANTTTELSSYKLFDADSILVETGTKKETKDSQGRTTRVSSETKKGSETVIKHETYKYVSRTVYYTDSTTYFENNEKKYGHTYREKYLLYDNGTVRTAWSLNRDLSIGGEFYVNECDFDVKASSIAGLQDKYTTEYKVLQTTEVIGGMEKPTIFFYSPLNENATNISKTEYAPVSLPSFNLNGIQYDNGRFSIQNRKIILKKGK